MAVVTVWLDYTFCAGQPNVGHAHDQTLYQFARTQALIDTKQPDLSTPCRSCALNP